MIGRGEEWQSLGVFCAMAGAMRDEGRRRVRSTEYENEGKKEDCLAALSISVCMK
jgi:hypothetical protein